MELHLTNHARIRMRQRNVSRDEIEQVIANAERVAPGRAGVMENDAVIGGRRLCAVVVAGFEPLLVVTIMVRE